MALVKYNRNYRPAYFGNFVDRFFNDEFFDKRPETFRPRVDIAESDKEFEIQFHVPGVKKDEININVEDNTLTVSGERKIENAIDLVNKMDSKEAMLKNMDALLYVQPISNPVVS